MRKFIWSFTTIVVLVVAALVYWKFYFVFADGTKAGQLNTFQKKGVIFKTWEGNIIQSGFKTNIQSNEFDFSVVDPKVAAILERNSGREVNLHYHRYNGSLPWRGMQGYIVDSVLEVRNMGTGTIIAPKVQ
ncbi:MAG: hypothetical protein EAZ62_03170 [Sphingobacteriia bacterium]|nr:MAG: hypothetical protein EAZ62_03170 [Sphingobacteriia bacterium]